MEKDARLWPRLTAAVCFGLMLTAMAVLRYACAAFGDGDYFWHCALGRDILRTGSIVHADRLSWLAAEQGLVYIDHSWLTDILLYLLSTVGGTDVVGAVLYMALTAFALAFCIYFFWGDARPDIPAVVMGAAAFRILWYAVCESPRPQQISVVLLVITLKILQVLQKTPRSRAALLLPPLALAWANLHGGLLLLMLGFIFLYLVLALVPDFRLGRVYHTRRGSARVYGLLLVLCAAAGLINPYGIRIYQQYTNVARACSVVMMTDWRPPSAQSYPIVLLFLLLLALILWHGDLSLTALAPVGAMAFLCIFHNRNVLWFCAVLAICVLQSRAVISLPVLDRIPADFQKHLSTAILAVGTAMAVIVCVQCWPAAIRNDRPGKLSEPLVQTLEKIRPQRLYTYINTGADVIRAGFQDAFDSRVDLFTEEQLLATKDLSKGSDGARLTVALKKYRFDALLLYKEEDAILISYFEERDDWTLAYTDDQYSLFLPAGGSAAP